VFFDKIKNFYVWKKFINFHKKNKVKSKIEIFNNQPETLMRGLCDKYGSDKGSNIDLQGKIYKNPAHNYTDFYRLIFNQIRNSKLNILECGLGSNDENIPSNMGSNGKPGASLRVFKEFFPNANIIGVDVDKKSLFEEERIKTYFLDQLNIDSIKEFKKNILETTFDIIIDDGLHSFHANRIFFENLIEKLKENGSFIIEDVKSYDLVRFQNYFKNSKYLVSYIRLENYKNNILDNNLILIQKNLHKE